MSKEVDEDRLDRAYKVGIYAGLEQASGVMEKKAVAAFQRGDDKMAFAYREQAKEFKAMSDKSHPGPR